MNVASRWLVVPGCLLAASGPAFAAGWEGQVVRAQWLYPEAQTVIESHDVVAGPGVELPPELIDNSSEFSIDLGPDTVQFNFLASTHWNTKPFNGWSFTDVDGTIPPITGYSIEAFSPGILHVNGIVTSFDANHVQANFSNLTIQFPGSFIRLKVTFGPEPLPWTDLGSGLAGYPGVPSLKGTGTLLADSAVTLDLYRAKPSAPAMLFISTESRPAPFKGGTLVPVPVAMTAVLVTDGTGAISFGIVHWPQAVPPGSTFFFQYAVEDDAAPQRVALSNALQALTP